MTDSNLILDVSAERLQEVLQSAGYRVTVSEQNGMVQLLSASQGVGFAARMGNPALPEGQFLDYTLSCALRVQGELPAGLAERWNVEKRFARLTVQGAFLVLELDVIVAGGVSENYLLATTELWDRLLQEFLLFLRANAAPGAGEEAGQSRNRCPRRRPNPRPSRRRTKAAGGAGPASAMADPVRVRRPPRALPACETDHEQHPETAHESPYRRRRAAGRRRGGAVALMRGSPARAAKASPRRKPPPSRRRPPPPTAGVKPPAVATLGAVQVDRDELQRQLQALLHRRRARAQDNRAGLDQWLRARLAEGLDRTGAGAGWQDKPEVKRAFQAAQEQILMQSYLESVSRAPDDYPTEADLASAYERAKPQLAQPALYRVSQIFLPAPLGDAEAVAAAPQAGAGTGQAGPGAQGRFAALARHGRRMPAAANRAATSAFAAGPADAGDAPGGRATQDRRRPGAVRRGLSYPEAGGPASGQRDSVRSGQGRTARRAAQPASGTCRALYLEGLLNAGTVSIDGAALNAAFEQTAAAPATGGAVASAKP